MRRSRPWAMWLGAVLVSFGAMEYHGFKVGARWPTLSDALATWVRPAPRTLGVLFLGGWLWLVAHVLHRVNRVAIVGRPPAEQTSPGPGAPPVT